MTFDSLWTGQVAMAALAQIAFAMAVGSLLFGAWLGAEGGRAKVSPAHYAWRRARGSLSLAALVLGLAELGWLVYEAAAMSGAGLGGAFGALPTVLADTHVGHAWSLLMLGALALLVLAWLRPAGPAGDALLWLAVLVVAAGQASIGHAADAGPWSPAVLVQMLHVLSTAVWGGIVLAGGMAVLPALGASIARGALIRVAQRVSRVSMAAVLAVLASGAFNAWRGTGGSLAVLDASTWGRVLLLKLVLVALALVLGGLNRFSALPRLRRTAATADARTFTNVLYLEAIAMIGVFVAAAVLASIVPGFAAMR
ncbi:CopD family protein [Burkholderia glumae]|uniref:CopD family protein n=1 Tax=Burkholderia glumae TaxID=337 RepID=UPI002150BA2B|nr:CopD family protein [Burkholderia glumae]UVS97007.1 copper resistance protein CopD [Burkholderia glumae]